MKKRMKRYELSERSERPPNKKPRSGTLIDIRLYIWILDTEYKVS